MTFIFFLKSYQEVPSLAGNDMGGILSMTLVGTAAMTHRPSCNKTRGVSHLFDPLPFAGRNTIAGHALGTPMAQRPELRCWVAFFPYR